MSNIIHATFAPAGFSRDRIEQSPAFYRAAALNCDDPVLVRACLLLAADEIEGVNGDGSRASANESGNPDLVLQPRRLLQFNLRGA